MKQINPAADEKQMLKVARVAGLVIVALGVIFAYKIQGVADALGWFWSLSALTGLFMWFGVLWRKTNATGAWASFIVMFIIWAIVGQPGAALKPLFPGVSFLGIYGDKTCFITFCCAICLRELLLWSLEVIWASLIRKIISTSSMHCSILLLAGRKNLSSKGSR